MLLRRDERYFPLFVEDKQECDVLFEQSQTIVAMTEVVAVVGDGGTSGSTTGTEGGASVALTHAHSTYNCVYFGVPLFSEAELYVFLDVLPKAWNVHRHCVSTHKLCVRSVMLVGTRRAIDLCLCCVFQSVQA